MTSAEDLRADVVVSGLPDRGEPLCDALLDAIHARLIVITDSEYPATRRAGAALLERLERRKTPVIYTRTGGSVEISVKESGWEARAMDGRRVCSP